MAGRSGRGAFGAFQPPPSTAPGTRDISPFLGRWEQSIVKPPPVSRMKLSPRPAAGVTYSQTPDVVVSTCSRVVPAGAPPSTGNLSPADRNRVWRRSSHGVVTGTGEQGYRGAPRAAHLGDSWLADSEDRPVDVPPGRTRGRSLVPPSGGRDRASFGVDNNLLYAETSHGQSRQRRSSSDEPVLRALTPGPPL